MLQLALPSACHRQDASCHEPPLLCRDRPGPTAGQDGDVALVLRVHTGPASSSTVLSSITWAMARGASRSLGIRTF